MYVPGIALLPTKHWNANATSRYSAPLAGNLTRTPANSKLPLTTQAWLYVDGLDVAALPPATTTPAKLIAGFTDAINQAHAADKKIWLGTIPPASNAIMDGTVSAPNSERYRETVNAWIRTQHLADGVIDFDVALRSPSNPTVLNPAYSGPDHLHPNLAGYQVMANAVNLDTLTG